MNLPRVSRKLWEARQAIESEDPEVGGPLMDAWVRDARQCFQMGDVAMLYSVLPWEQYGHLGAGVALLYTSQLFASSPDERGKLRASVKVSEEEVDQLVTLGCRVLRTQRLPQISVAVKNLLNRIVSSPYFDAEQPGGLVLNELDNMVAGEHSEGRRSTLQTLRRKLQEIYTPTKGRTVFGYLSWHKVKPGALTSPGNRGMGPTYAKAIAAGVIDVEKMVEVLKACWPACLREMSSSHFVKHLLTTRPPKSTAPHSYALLDCIEHTWLWMLNSNLDVYSTVRGAKYSNLGSCIQGVMYRRFDGEVLPRGVEKTLRRLAIEAYLAGAPEPTVDTSDNPLVVGVFKAMKCEYIAGGFDKSYFPAESEPWLARDPQDLDEHARMKCWLWNEDFLGVHLHNDLLRQGGVNNEELEVDEQDVLRVLFLKEKDIFENRNGFLVPDRISPLDSATLLWAPDLFIPPGPGHKI